MAVLLPVSVEAMPLLASAGEVDLEEELRVGSGAAMPSLKQVSSLKITQEVDCLEVNKIINLTKEVAGSLVVRPKAWVSSLIQASEEQPKALGKILKPKASVRPLQLSQLDSEEHQILEVPSVVAGLAKTNLPALVGFLVVHSKHKGLPSQHLTRPLIKELLKEVGFLADKITPPEDLVNNQALTKLLAH